MSWFICHSVRGIRDSERGRLPGQMILQGPFPVPSLWFCDHIRPWCLGSLSAAECSPAWRRGIREQREPQPRPPRRSPGQQREEQGRGGRGTLPGCLFPETSRELTAALPCSPHLCVGSPPSVALPGFQSPTKAGHSGLQSQPCLLLGFFCSGSLGNPSEPLTLVQVY